MSYWKQVLCVLVAVIEMLINKNTYGQIKFEKGLRLNQQYPVKVFVSGLEYNKKYYFQSVSYVGWTRVKFLSIADSNGTLIKSVRTDYVVQIDRLKLSRAKELITTATDTSFASIHVSKYDTSLNFKWKTKIYLEGVAENCYYVEMPDSSIIGATTASSVWGSPKDGLYVFNLDKNGNFLWSKTIRFHDTIPAILPRSMINTKDGNIMIFGTTLSGSGVLSNTTPIKSAFFACKIKPDGNLIWCKRYTAVDTLWFYGGDVIEINNGDYIACGEGRLLVSLFMKIDSIGNLKWFKYLTLSSESRYFNPLFVNQLILDKNNFLYGYGSVKKAIIGFPVTNSGLRYLIKMDTAGNVYYARKYTPNYDEVANHNIHFVEWGSRSYCTLLSDHSLLMGGGIYQLPFSPTPTNNPQNKVLYIKTDSLFHSCSSDSLDTFTINDLNVIVESGGVITAINQGTITSENVSVLDWGTDSTLCFCSIPGSLSLSPASCFSNGSATFTPAYPYNYSYFWSSPIISNSNTANNIPPGNYTLTIADSSGCSIHYPFTIPANYTLPVSVSGNSLICSGQTASISIHGAPYVTWNTGQTDSTIFVQPSVTTTYSAVVTGGTCTDSVYYTISVNPTPTLAVSTNSAVINNGDTLTLTLSGANQYSFVPSDNVFLQGTLLSLYPRESTSYCIRGEKDGCYDTVCVSVKVDGSCFDYEVPNVFTPNGDNVNDEWLVRWKCPELIKDYHLEIVDRWGVKLFESVQWNKGWDGRNISGEQVPTGTYYYVIEYSVNGKKIKNKGYITLLR